MLDSKQVVFGLTNLERLDCFMWFMASTITIEDKLDWLDWLDLLRLGRN